MGESRRSREGEGRGAVFPKLGSREGGVHGQAVQPEFGHAQQVVGGPDHPGGRTVLDETDLASLPEVADGLHPAEDLFDSFSNALTDGIAGVACRSCVDG